MNEYHINIFYSDEDRTWVADTPDLDAAESIPAPRYRPAIYQAR